MWFDPFQKRPRARCYHIRRCVCYVFAQLWAAILPSLPQLPVLPDLHAYVRIYDRFAFHSGASRTLIDKPELEAYQTHIKYNIKLTNGSHIFLFGTGIHINSGGFMSRFLVFENSVLCFKIQVLTIYVSF